VLLMAAFGARGCWMHAVELDTCPSGLADRIEPRAASP